MIVAVLVNEIARPKGFGGEPDYNNALLYLMRDLLPNGMSGVAIAGLLASFMAGMAANISAFNRVFSYDLWEMDYLQTLFGFFNAPLFATFILGMFWKRMTSTAGWVGLVSGTGAAIVVGVLSEGTLGGLSLGVLGLTARAPASSRPGRPSSSTWWSASP